MIFFLFLIFCFYLPFQIALNPAEGIDLASSRVFAIIIFILWLIQSLKNKRLNVPFSAQTLLLISFLIMNILSVFYAENVDWAIRKLMFLLSFCPLYFVASDFSRSKERFQKIITFLFYGAGLAAFIGLLQFSSQFFLGLNSSLELWQKISATFFGSSFSEAVLQYSSWLVGIGGKTYFRAIAFFPDPHMFSFYLEMLLPFGILLYFSENKSTKKILFFIISLLILLAIILTFSRGSYLGLIFGIVAALLIFKNKLRRILQLIIIIGLTAIIISVIIPENPIIQRFSSILNFSEGSNLGRIENWKQSWQVISENPWLGVGLGNYPLAIKPSTTYREPIYSHNLYFDIASESGLINLGFWILLIMASILGYIEKRRTNPVYSSGAISLIIFSAHALVETPIFSVQILPLLLIIIALGNNVKSKKIA